MIAGSPSLRRSTEDHDGVAGQCRFAVTVVAVGGDVDSHAFATESACDRFGQLDFVLNDEDAHPQSLPRGSAPASSRAVAGS